jgi:hypothetical protein
MFGWGGPSDLKKQAAGEQVDITPYYLIPSSLFVILGAWYLLGEHIYWMLVTPHEAIVHVTGWLRYFLHAMIGRSSSRCHRPHRGARHCFLSVLGLFNSHHRCCFHRCLYYAPSRNFNLQYSCMRSSVGFQGEAGEKMAWLGFAFLLIGYVLQACINFMS